MDQTKRVDPVDYAARLTVEQFNDGAVFDIADGLCELDRVRFYNEVRNRIKSEKWISLKEFDDMCKAHKNDLRKREADNRKAARDKQRLKDGTLLDPVGKAALGEGFNGISDILGDAPNYGKYYCSDAGIYYIVGFGDESAPVKVCSHPIFPTKRYINIETGCELLDLSYKLHKDDTVWKTARLIDRKTISQARLIPSLSSIGMDITSENAREVVKYLAEVDNLNRPIIPVEETISRLGWVDGRGFSPYIQGVTYDNGGRFADAFSAVHEHGSFKEWSQAAAEIMMSKAYIPARLVLSASVASVLLKWTCNQPFFVHLWSPESGSGKTITLMLACSVWADPGIGGFMLSMNSTAVAFEQMDSFCNNLPLVYDELQSANMDTEKIIYAHGEGTGKARGAKDGGLREQTRWMNIAITSGEQPLSFTSRAGAINRVISIEGNGQLIPGSVEHMREYADTLRENYGFLGKQIVSRIQKDPSFIDAIKVSYRRFAEQLAREATGKQANYAAALLVGDALLSSILFGAESSKYALVPADIIPYLATAEMVDINLKVKAWLCGFVASETAYFIKADSRPTDEVRSRIYGKKEADGSVLFLFQSFKEEMEKRGWAWNSFLTWCNKRQYIKTNYKEGSSRHWYIERTVEPIGYSQFICFLPSFFDDSRQKDSGFVPDFGLKVDIDHPF